MATATGISVLGPQLLMTYPAADAFVATFFGGAVKPAIDEYTGWMKVLRSNTLALIEVNSKPIYGQGLWLQTATTPAGTHQLWVVWRRANLQWTTYSGPFA